VRILLTGATGFTGLHFSAIAKSRGHTIIPLKARLDDPHALATELQLIDFTHVVHFAAISFVGHTDPRAFYDVNLFGTLNLLDAIITHGVVPKMMVLASSATIYGNALISPVPETRIPAPVSHYATSKLAMECMARTYVERLPLLIARPFNYTGPRQSISFLLPKLVDHFRKRSPVIELGNLDVEREFNDVRMVCDAYLTLLEQGVAGETYNICSGIPYTLMSVIGKLTGLTGYHIDVHVNPRFVRANEIKSLCGDPQKLLATVGSVVNVSLDDTLSWMLKETMA
jgi:nucleoside-diphosphate-sugar epimerase